MMEYPTVSKIGVLTSGGDAPGMNAAIRGAVRTAQCLDIECIGIRHGYEGLLRGDMRSRFNSYQIGINMGVYSPNEVRELEDMNPREGGDVWLTPLNMRITDETGGTQADGTETP